MEFVHFVLNQRSIIAKKSKLKAFRRWLCEPRNPFGRMIFYLLTIDDFDREHRTPEVHGTSRIADVALRCPQWPRDDSQLDAINVCTNIWPFIVQTLNGEPVQGASYTPMSKRYFSDFSRWQEMNLEDIWKRFAGNADERGPDA